MLSFSSSESSAFFFLTKASSTSKVFVPVTVHSNAYLVSSFSSSVSEQRVFTSFESTLTGRSNLNWVVDVR